MKEEYLNSNAILLLGMIHGMYHTISTEENTEEQIEQNIDKLVDGALKLGIIKKPGYAITNHSLRNAIRDLLSVVKKETSR